MTVGVSPCTVSSAVGTCVPVSGTNMLVTGIADQTAGSRGFGSHAPAAAVEAEPLCIT